MFFITVFSITFVKIPACIVPKPFIHYGDITFMVGVRFYPEFFMLWWPPMFKKSEYKGQRLPNRIVRSMQKMWNKRKLEELGLFDLQIEVKRWSYLLCEGKETPLWEESCLNWRLNLVCKQMKSNGNKFSMETEGGVMGFWKNILVWILERILNGTH